MREPRLLNESEIKEIEELLDSNMHIDWKEGVIEDYIYTKNFLESKNKKTNKKVPSRIKVGASALLGYIVFNIVRSSIAFVAALLAYFLSNLFNSNFIVSRLFEINLFVGIYLGYSICKSIGNKILKTDDGIRKYMLTVGILFVINYIIFLIDYFMFKEQSLFNIIVSLLLGIVLIVLNLKEKDYDY